MTPFLSFLLKANLTLILMYGVYFLCFRRDTFYGYIRWFFLAAIMASILFPLINVSAWLTKSPAAMEVSQNISNAVYRIVLVQPQIEQTVEPGVTRTIPFNTFFLWGWLSIAVFMIGKRLLQFAYIIRLQGRNQRKRYGKSVIIPVNKNIQPFSFFNRIFLNPAFYTQEEADAIITHEQVHCRQGHTIDILLVEMLVCLFWFNPVAWLLRHDLKQNIEYYTDRMTLRLSNFDRKHYQYSLLRVSNNAFQIVNHFHFNNLKKRIIMMNKKESPRIVSAKYLLVIPALAAALLIVQISGLQASKSVVDESPAVTATDIVPPPVLKKVERSVPAKATMKKTVKYEPVKKDSVVVVGYGTKSPNSYYTSNLTYTTCDSGKNLPHFATGYIRGINFSTDSTSSGQPLIIVKKVISGEEFNKIDPSNVESIDILKDKNATNQYGEGAANGVIIVTMKKETNTGSQQANSVVTSIITTQKEMPLKPLYFVDGKEVSSLDNISPDSIESFSILKDASATAKFGARAANGVILITLKK